MIDLFKEAEPAEVSIVGSVLIDAACLPDVLDSVKETDFLHQDLKALFVAARDLFNEGKTVDATTVLDRAGRHEYFKLAVDCMDLTPTAANVLSYCEILRKCARLHRLREVGANLQDAVSVDEAQDVLSAAMSELNERPGIRVTSLSQMLADFLQRMNQPKPDYIRWGFPPLDGTLTVGKGKYVFIAARPSTGKTALALQIAITMSRQKKVGFFSLETDEETAADRIAAANFDRNLSYLKKRQLDLTEMQVLANAASEMFRKPEPQFDFVTGSAMTVAEIKSTALARHMDVVFIDYVQLIKPTGNADRTQAMQQVSMDLRAFTQQTGITVIALAQLRRPEAGTKQKAPTMNDLKESGQFEQDADVVMLLYHEKPDNRFSDRFLKIEKNKEGEAGVICRLSFDGRKQRFRYVPPDGTQLEELPEEPGMDQMSIPFEEATA